MHFRVEAAQSAAAHTPVIMRVRKSCPQRRSVCLSYIHLDLVIGPENGNNGMILAIRALRVRLVIRALRVHGLSPAGRGHLGWAPGAPHKRAVGEVNAEHQLHARTTSMSTGDHQWFVVKKIETQAGMGRIAHHRLPPPNCSTVHLESRRLQRADIVFLHDLQPHRDARCAELCSL